MNKEKISGVNIFLSNMSKSIMHEISNKKREDLTPIITIDTNNLPHEM
jgi:hypothetical protein